MLAPATIVEVASVPVTALVSVVVLPIDTVASDEEIAPVSVVLNDVKIDAVSVDPIAEVSVPGAPALVEVVSDEPTAVESEPVTATVANAEVSEEPIV